MSKEQPGEVFMPPNMLKAKVGGTVSGLDSAAIQRAEAAMDTLKVEFSDWITKDIARLNEANELVPTEKGCRDRWRALPRQPRLEGPSHDI